MLLHSDIDHRFTYHPPKDGQPQKYEELRAQARTLGKLIIDLTPSSREQSLAITKLEESIM